jgi:hypothetical protein
MCEVLKNVGPKTLQNVRGKCYFNSTSNVSKYEYKDLECTGEQATQRPIVF